jgi:hypothetical protein
MRFAIGKEPRNNLEPIRTTKGVIELLHVASQ